MGSLQLSEAGRAGRPPAAPGEFEMRGLCHDSLLSFLALVGAMRLLDAARPEWDPRASWGGMYPVIHADGCAGRGALLAALVEGLEAYGKKVARLPRVGPRITAEEFGRMQLSIDPDIAAALGSGGAVDANGAAQITPLCMTPAAGLQYFVAALKVVTRAGAGGRAGVERDLNEALFEWNGVGPEGEGRPTFRWDPAECRPHAYGARDLIRERPTSPAGANRLAAAGFTAFDCMPAGHGLCTTSCLDARYARSLGLPDGAYEGRDHVFWPAWEQPLSAAAIDTLMHYPYVPRIARGDPGLPRDLEAYGVARIMKASTFYDGKYKGVRRAEQVA